MTDHVLSFTSSIPPLLETKSDHSRLRIRFNQLSRERRLLTLLLLLFAIIMCGLLIGIFVLSLVLQGRSPIIYRERNATNIGTSDGVLHQNEQHILSTVTNIYTTITTEMTFTTLMTTTISLTTSTEKILARYGESCDNDNGCARPFVCQKKSSATPGMCRCPSLYEFVKDQCVGGLNALCTKDIDCQQYMLCSGMNDGTRRCQCQKQYEYDSDKNQCHGDYQASCESNKDCRANLICNKTTKPSTCSCESHYLYHSSLRKCRGEPGAVCHRLPDVCIDNAQCRDGACECSNQFIPNEDKICIDPCPEQIPNPPRIRYPGNCQRFIDCENKSKGICPELTIFNLHSQECDYPKNVPDCR